MCIPLGLASFEPLHYLEDVLDLILKLVAMLDLMYILITMQQAICISTLKSNCQDRIYMYKEILLLKTTYPMHIDI